MADNACSTAPPLPQVCYRQKYGMCAAQGALLGRQQLRARRSEEHTSELQSPYDLVCRLLLEKKNKIYGAAAQESREQAVLARELVAQRHDTIVYPRAPPPVSLHAKARSASFCFFFFNDTAPPEIYPLSLHDALPI